MKLVSPKKVSRRIRSLRGPRTQEQLAKRWKMRPNYISRYERGMVPNPENLVRIARAEGVSVDWLLTGKGRKITEAEPVTNPVPEKPAATVALVP